MNCLPELREQLVTAASRLQSTPSCDAEPEPRAAAPRRRRRRLRTSRRVLALSVGFTLLVAAVALAAAGVFSEGTALGPETAASAGEREGIALPGTSRLLPLSTPDPEGGLPWGVRVSPTTRGLTCLSVGRLDYATVGVLGQDGAFADDGRFHPLSPNYFEPLGCAVTDADGHAFVNVALRQLPASGLWAQTPADGGCQAAPPPVRDAAPEQLHTTAAPPATCPAADVREAFFGILGPDAKTITYHVPGGGTQTTPLLAPDGAYLLVFREGTIPVNPLGNGSTGGPGLAAGEIAAVTYADGNTCRVPTESLVESCSPVGYIPQKGTATPPRELATTAHVRLREANRYCTTGHITLPCEGTPPPDSKPIPSPPGQADQQQQVLAEISFRAPVAVTSSRAFYEAAISYGHVCKDNGAGAEDPTDYNIRAGQLVTITFLIPRSCAGPVSGTVQYVQADGAATATPVVGLPGQAKPVTIAQFRLQVP